MAKRCDKYILDEHDQVVAEPDLLRWANWFEKADRHIGDTTAGESRVSTVFLSLDQNHGGIGAPVLYETMIFGGPLDQERERYETRQQAEAGHERWVERLKATLKGDQRCNL